ncbi:hypothetical protein BASA81_001398 [Batrachochytrium salamandrivorans]|nr:hypothetical protein BASA81_001398 [Batrachochytrium salamandrivorans]
MSARLVAGLRDEVRFLMGQVAEERAQNETLDFANACQEAEIATLQESLAELRNEAKNSKAGSAQAATATAAAKAAAEKWKEVEEHNLRFFKALAATELIGSVVQDATGCSFNDKATTITNASPETQELFNAGDWNFYVGTYNKYHQFRNSLCHTPGLSMWKCGQDPPLPNDYNLVVKTLSDPTNQEVYCPRCQKKSKPGLGPTNLKNEALLCGNCSSVILARYKPAE